MSPRLFELVDRDRMTVEVRLYWVKRARSMASKTWIESQVPSLAWPGLASDAGNKNKSAAKILQLDVYEEVNISPTPLRRFCVSPSP